MSHNNNAQQIYFNWNKSAQVCKIMIRRDARLIINDTVFTMIDTAGDRQSFLSPVSGTVTKLYIHESDILSSGSIILEYEECRHTVVYKNLCSACGIHLNFTEGFIRIEPSFPDVTISREEGFQYDYQESQHLLRRRKLHLLVDLDQTLVHTTNSKNYYPPSSDIISYQLTPISPTFHTKLRPGVKTFLTNLHPFYQFYLVTFGDRLYANTIAKLVDPTTTFFSHRILSRDECLSLTNKAANLSSLFPCSDSLVCIVDDREDVWNSAPNLVQVKPYIWFRNVGDINDTYLPSQNKNSRSFSENDICNDSIADTNLYLDHLQTILKRIHTVFYEAYDQWVQDRHGPMPDLKQIVPGIRQQILSSVSLCFSHLMPQDYPIEKHRATIIAKAMGAQVTDDLQFDSNGKIQTTHVIAGKRTFKVYQAQQNKVNIVTPEWLIDCYENWEKKPEENYIPTSKYQVRKSRLFTDETPRVTKRRHCNTQQEIPIDELSLSDPISLTTVDTAERLNIEKKVNDLSIADNDDEADNMGPKPKKHQCTMMIAAPMPERKYDHNNEDSDSDSSYGCKLHNLDLNKKDYGSSDEHGLSDDETPRGWKEDSKRKQSYS